MHSSRMRTVRSSSHRGGGVASVHAGIDTTPPRCGPGDPTPDVGLETPPPQVWAWRNSPGCGPGDPPSVGPGDTPGQIPLNFLLGVGLEICKVCWDTTPQRPAARHAGIPPAMHAGIPPPVDRMTDTCKNITFANYVCRR